MPIPSGSSTRWPLSTAERAPASHSARIAADRLAPLLVVLPLLGVDLVLPALPGIADAFAAPVADAQWALSVYVLGIAGMHLVLGPLADRHGRRPVLLAGLAIFAIASAACALAPTLDALLAARALQGIGAASGLIIARAIVRDVYGAAGAGRMMGYVMSFFGVGAIVLPFTGGILTELWGWRAPFWGGMAYGALALLLSWRGLPETLPQRVAQTERPHVLREYRDLIADRRFIVVAVAGCLVGGAMFSWIASSSFVVQRAFGHGPVVYGLVFASTVAGFVAMSLLAARLAPRLGSGRLVTLGSLIAAAGGLAGVAFGLAFTLTLGLVLIAISLMVAGHGFTLSQSMAASMAPFPHLAATASALHGFMLYGLNALLVVLNGLIYDGTAFPMLALIALLTATAMLLYAALKPRTS